jgi:hypothetical protein
MPPGYGSAPAASGGGGSTPTGTGLRKVVAGVEAAAAALLLDADVDAAAAVAVTKLAAGAANTVLCGGAPNAFRKLVNADVDAAAAIAGTKVSSDFGAQQVSCTASVSVTMSCFSRNFADNADRCVFQTSGVSAGTETVLIGVSTTASTADGWPTVGIFPTTTLNLGVSGSAMVSLTSSLISARHPIVGYVLGTSPYGVHGGFTFAFAADANYTVTAAQYSLDRGEFTTGVITAGRTVTWPHPSSEARGYYKEIVNLTNQTLTISTGTGTTRTLATNLGQKFWFGAAGVKYSGPTFTP